jgi:hypothetical protein
MRESSPKEKASFDDAGAKDSRNHCLKTPLLFEMLPAWLDLSLNAYCCFEIL